MGFVHRKSLPQEPINALKKRHNCLRPSHSITFVRRHFPFADWWYALPYAGDVSGALDFGITAHVPMQKEFVNSPLDNKVFLQTDGPGKTAFSWVNLHGFEQGDQLDYFFYKPDGSQYAHWNWTTNDIRYGWWTAGIGLPDSPDAGLWTLNAQ